MTSKIQYIARARTAVLQAEQLAKETWRDHQTSALQCEIALLTAEFIKLAEDAERESDLDAISNRIARGMVFEPEDAAELVAGVAVGLADTFDGFQLPEIARALESLAAVEVSLNNLQEEMEARHIDIHSVSVPQDSEEKRDDDRQRFRDIQAENRIIK